MSNDWLNRISQMAQHAIGTLRVRSALNPFLWACPVVGVTCFGAAWALRANQTVELILEIAGVSPIGLLAIVGIYLAIYRPDKLQSEEYQLRRQTLELIHEKGGKIRVDPASLQSIVIPAIDPAETTTSIEPTSEPKK